jgi:hypothetical protein
MHRFARALVVLAVACGLVQAAPVLAAQSVVSRADLDQALAARRASDESARATIHALLARDEVKALAHRAGLDLRRADAAVATLDGDELRTLSVQAAAADASLAGGQTIQISLVAALLIIIIVILLVTR